MGSVGDELLLPAQQSAEACSHPVERASQRPLFAAALDRSGRRQITRLDAAGGLLEAADRARGLPRDQGACDCPQQQDDASKDHETEDRTTRGAVDGGGALGDADGANGPAGAEYGHGGREDLRAERLARAIPSGRSLH